jgi:hypothetical protein
MSTAPTELDTLREKALAYCREHWTRAHFEGGTGPSDATFWWVENRPDLSYWPIPTGEPPCPPH